jgi:hypothetical protein
MDARTCRVLDSRFVSKHKTTVQYIELFYEESLQRLNLTRIINSLYFITTTHEYVASSRFPAHTRYNAGKHRRQFGDLQRKTEKPMTGS